MAVPQRTQEVSMRSGRTIALALMLVVILAGCAAGTNTAADVPAGDGDVAGFWMGVWHGMIAPITFVISLFNSDVNFYEVHNNGSWYNFGFVLGAGIVFGGGGTASSRS